MYSLDYEDNQVCPDDVWFTALPRSMGLAHEFAIKTELPEKQQQAFDFLEEDANMPPMTTPQPEESLLSFLEKPLLFEEVEQLLEMNTCHKASPPPLYAELSERTESSKLAIGAVKEEQLTFGAESQLMSYQYQPSVSPVPSSLGSDGEEYPPSPEGTSSSDNSSHEAYSDCFDFEDYKMSFQKNNMDTSVPFREQSDRYLAHRAVKFTDVTSRPDLYQVPPVKAEKPRRRKGRHLWEFLLDVLSNPAYNPELIRWVDKSKGVFKIEKSQQVARLWGARKQKTKMTYEYMSRAMRHYYSNGILQRVWGKRLVYQFGQAATGWHEVALASP